MTAVIRAGQAVEMAKSFGEPTDPNLRPRGWWVLACGNPMDRSNFDQREEAREALLEETARAGINLPENIWVWDDTGMAQLVITTVPTLERAQALARRLKAKGLTIRVRREDF